MEGGVNPALCLELRPDGESGPRTAGAAGLYQNKTQTVFY